MNSQPQLYQVTPELMPSLTPAERRDFNDLLQVWQTKLSRNFLRKRYYDGKNHLKDLGISIPPALTDVETVVGWPAKAVDALAVRSIFDGFTIGGRDDSDLTPLLTANDFKLLYSEAVTSELINSCSFCTVSSGDGEDEPEVLINFYGATSAAALWDVRRKRIRCGFTIADYIDEPSGECVPTEVNYYTDGFVIKCRRDESTGSWATERVPTPVGRPLMEPLRYRPSLERPFGKSRISRAVMSITDSAVRTCLRAEVSAELYTSPQRYLLGADEDTFGGYESDVDARARKVEAYLGTIFAITPNENGDIPQYGQLSAMSMQPHTDYLRSLAARFAGETSIPISSLGVVSDNPSSAEAMYAASEDLIIEAEALNDVNGRSLENVARMVMALREGRRVQELTEEQLDVRANFKNPMRPSLASQTDAVIKQAEVMPWMLEGDEALSITLSELGYSESQVNQLVSSKKRAEGRENASAVLQSVLANGTAQPTEPAEEPAEKPAEEPEEAEEAEEEPEA